jgi:hypothetical protein
VKKHRACASEFDYAGWKTWGRWRRSDGRKASLVHGKGGASLSLNVKGEKKDCWNTCDYPSECRWGRRFGIPTPLTDTFPTTETATPTPPSPTSQNPIEVILAPSTSFESDKPDIWTSLIASAKRRKSMPPSSPLSTSETNSDSVGSVATDMLKNLMKRKTARRGGLKRQISYPSRLLTVAKSAATKDEEVVGEASLEATMDVDMDDDFAPLERVRSRGEMMEVDDV